MEGSTKKRKTIDMPIMNKNTKILLGCILILSASCAADDAGVVRSLEVTAEISDTHTRVDADDTHASDYDKDRFVTDDIILISKSGTAGIRYKRTATGTWTPVDAANPMTTTGGETFTATFPPEFSGILPDQTTPVAFWKSNQLSATAAASGNRISFSFVPAACKITVIIIYKAENIAQGATVAGKGLCSGNPAKEETILLLKTSESKSRHTYSGIFSLAAATTYTITVKADVMGTGTYTELGSGLTLQAGYEYRYTFTATDELILNNVVVTPFVRDPDWTADEEDAGSAT